MKKKQRNRPPAWKRRLRTTTVPSKLTLDDNPEDSGDSRTKRKATDPACEGSKKQNQNQCTPVASVLKPLPPSNERTELELSRGGKHRDSSTDQGDAPGVFS